MKIEEVVSERTTRKEVITYLTSFNEINIKKIGKLLGQGLTHRVYTYAGEQIVKVPKKGYIKKQESARQLKKSYDLCQQYFREYVWPSKVITSSVGYAILQKRLPKIEHLSQRNLSEVIDQMDDVILRNQRLQKERRFTIDFTGFGGLKNAIKWLTNKKTVVTLDNFVIVRNGKKTRLVLEDFQLLNLNFGRNPLNNLYRIVIYQLSFQLNAAILWMIFRKKIY
jgi:hypothetical protein